MVKSASSCAPRFSLYHRLTIHPATMARKCQDQGPGDRIELDIRDLTVQGDGRAWSGDSEFIVRRTFPGDRVEATVRRRKGRTCEATPNRITNAEIPRVALNALTSECAAGAGGRISVTLTSCD